MTADVELLPLPEPDLGLLGQIAFIRSDELLLRWCHTNVEHHTAAKDAEIEALQAEVERLQTEIDNMWATGVHSCHENCQRTNCVLRRDNKRLVEALRVAEAALADIGDADREPGDDLAWCERRAAEPLPTIRALLRNQEEGK